MNTNSTKDIKGGAGVFCKVSIAVPSGIVHSTFPAALLNKPQRIIQSIIFTKEFREYLIRKADYKCHYCGIDIIEWKDSEYFESRIVDGRTVYFSGDIQIRKFAHMSVDHKIPLCKGGTSTEENLVAACHECNTKKSIKDYWRFVNEIRDRNKPERVNEDSAINK